MSRKRNHAMNRHPVRLHPVERQRLRATWSAAAVDAGIHALTGQATTVAVEKAATLYYVVLGAALAENMPDDGPEISVLRGSCNTIEECVGKPALTELQRLSLASGLEAVKRLVPQLREQSLFESALATARAIASRSP